MAIDTEAQLADRRVKEWFLLEKAYREREAEEAARAHPERTIITLSRQFGAGGHTIATRLLAQLGQPWQVWDREIIEAVAESATLRKEMVEAMDERTQSWLAQGLRSLTGAPVVATATYRSHLGSVLFALSQQGRKIILGRGANFVLKDALNVRLVASLDFRVRTTMRREKVPHDFALKRVKDSDVERTAFTRSVFGREVDNPDGYDMVLHTDTLGFDPAVAAIIAAHGKMVSPAARIVED